MKNMKISLYAVCIFASSLYTVDIPENIAWCGSQIKTYGNNLLHDTTTQITSLGSLVTAIGCYQYYHYNAALVCLDGHPNSRIMHKSQLIYMSYADFINTLESLESYAAVLEFVHNYCSQYCSVSDVKINKFIALAQDLQNSNQKRSGADVERENSILENFQNNLIIIQKNMKDELVNNAINANTRALNLYSISRIVEIINIFFGNK